MALTFHQKALNIDVSINYKSEDYHINGGIFIALYDKRISAIWSESDDGEVLIML